QRDQSGLGKSHGRVGHQYQSDAEALGYPIQDVFGGYRAGVGVDENSHGFSSGRLARKVVFPGTESNSSDPWFWASASVTMPSPSPVPLSELFVVKNGSKIFCRTCSGIPFPVSVISTTARFDTAWIPTVRTPPSSMA